MALETSTYVVGLVTSNPDGGDQRSTADDHIRLLKAVLKRTFPLMDGAVSLSHTQLMRLNDVSASVQFQLNTLRDGSATAQNAIYANSASYAGQAGNALSLGGVAAADFARQSQANTFSGVQTVHAVDAIQAFIQSGATADNGKWRWRAVSERFLGQLYNDSDNVQATWLVVDRTGTVVDSISLGATLLTWNGNTVLTSASSLNASNLGSGSIPDARVPLSAVQQHQASLTVASASIATIATTAISASSAAALAGYSVAETPTGSTIPVRSGAGYLYAAYFNQSSADSENPSVGQVVVLVNGDNFFRKSTPANLGAYLEARNITGRAGTAKTLASGSGPPSLSGSTNGDLFYYY